MSDDSEGAGYIDPKRIAARLDRAREEFKEANPEADLSAFDSVKEEFLRNHPSEMSPEEAIRLKHEINQSITCGGMNAREFRDFCTMTPEDYKKVKKDYREWIPQIRAIGMRGLCLWLAVGSGFAYFLQGWFKFIGIMVIFFVCWEFAKREGHREGFIDGYEYGREEGINKAFGIDSEAAEEFRDLSVEMEMDEMTLK